MNYPPPIEVGGGGFCEWVLNKRVSTNAFYRLSDSHAKLLDIDIIDTSRRDTQTTSTREVI